MVTLRHEGSFLKEINNLSASGKIQDSVALTAGTDGSQLTAQDAKTKIQKLIPTILQRINAARFYLDVIKNMNYAPYLGSQRSLSKAQKPLIDFSNSNFQVQINLLNSEPVPLNSEPVPFSLLNSEPVPLIVFIVLNGFFSNLISVEDCIAKIINIIYDLFQLDRSIPKKERQKLIKKIPNKDLTGSLRDFHGIDQDRNPHKTGSRFNIAKKIRNQLVHDAIDNVVVPIASVSSSGSVSAFKLHFHNSFFSSNTNPADTEMIAFCQNVYDETVNFVDTCYRLICADLQHNGVLPVPKGD